MQRSVQAEHDTAGLGEGLGEEVCVSPPTIAHNRTAGKRRKMDNDISRDYYSTQEVCVRDRRTVVAKFTDGTYVERVRSVGNVCSRPRSGLAVQTIFKPAALHRTEVPVYIFYASFLLTQKQRETSLYIHCRLNSFLYLSALIATGCQNKTINFWYIP